MCDSRRLTVCALLPARCRRWNTITDKNHTLHSEGSGEDSEWGFVGKLKEKGHYYDLGIDGSILKWILKNWMEGCKLDSCSLEEGQVVGFMELSNDVLGFRKRRQFD